MTRHRTAAAQETFGSRLRGRREAKQLSQEQLGEKIGVSKAAVSRWESNRDRPDYDKLVKITEELECSADYLLTGAEGVSGRMIDPETYKVLLRLDALPEALKEYVIGALQIAERTKSHIPERFIKAPTRETWQQFHEYLQALADSLPKGVDGNKSQ